MLLCWSNGKNLSHNNHNTPTLTHTYTHTHTQINVYMHCNTTFEAWRKSRQGGERALRILRIADAESMFGIHLRYHNKYC